MISAERKQELVKGYARQAGDTGSPEVQVAVLTERIRDLTEHMKDHKQDFNSRRGLQLMVSKRNRLTGYLKRVDRERYVQLIERLGLRK